MVMVICSIFDAKAEAWLTPMFFQAVGQAMRSFTDAVNAPDTEFGKHPEDYTLFELGTFDPRAGALQVFEAPNPLAKGVNLVQNLEVVK